MIGYLLVRIVEISFNIFHALFFYINKILLNIIHNSTIMVKTIKKKNNKNNRNDKVET